MLIIAILVTASAKVAVGVDSRGGLDLSLGSNDKDIIGTGLDAGDMEEIKDMDSTQLKEKVGVLLAELRQKNSLIDELSSALEKEKQTTEGLRNTMIADSKVSAGDMDDTVGLSQLKDEVGSMDTMDTTDTMDTMDTMDTVDTNGNEQITSAMKKCDDEQAKLAEAQGALDTCKAQEKEEAEQRAAAAAAAAAALKAECAKVKEINFKCQDIRTRGTRGENEKCPCDKYKEKNVVIKYGRPPNQRTSTRSNACHNRVGTKGSSECTDR